MNAWNRLRAASGRLQAAWSGLLHRQERPEPRHGAKPAEPPGEPEQEPEQEPEGVSPAMLTRMDGRPIARVAPYVDKPRHSHRRTK